MSIDRSMGRTAWWIGGLALALAGVALMGFDHEPEERGPTSLERLAAAGDASEWAVQESVSPPRLAQQDPVARGRYLVNHVSVCVECHSPRDETGAFIAERTLSGVECFADFVPPRDNGQGCVNIPNLTNHPTGLANHTDEEIITMLRDGLRPDGSALHPFMPYYLYHHMTDEDAQAIVAYLRAVPGVDHRVPPSEPPLVAPPSPAPPVPLEIFPAPEPSDPAYEQAVRGRYLAVNMDACVTCHTPEVTPGSEQLDFSRSFAGGRGFPAAMMGFPTPPFPEVIVSANLTSDETGLSGWTAEDVVRVLREGVEPSGSRICPPMPSGPHGGYAGLTDEDVAALAAYLFSLPPVENEVPECDPPAPPPAE